MESLNSIKLANKVEKGRMIWGIIICLFGAIFFSSKAIVVKLAYLHTDVSAVSLLALRMIFSLPFFLLSALVSSSRSGNTKFSIRQWIWIAVIGLLGYYVSSLLDFIGLQFVTAGIERLILFLYPTFVLVISSLFFHQKVNNTKWIAIFLAYMGLTIAYYSEINLTDLNGTFLFGSLLILICAITYAIYIVGSGQLLKKIGPNKFNSYAMSFACLGVLTHFFFTEDYSLTDFDSAVYGYGAVLAIATTIIPSYLVTGGIKMIGAESAAIIGSIGPVSTIVQAYFFLGEPITILQMTGTGFVLFGIILIGRNANQK